MKNWPDGLTLLTVLSTAETLLAHSSREGFGLDDPDDARRQIDRSETD